MADDPFKTFICSYPFQGGQWGFEIKARSFEEAQARVKAIGWGKVDGELMMKLPGYLPPSAISLLCWWKNLWGKP